MFKHSMIFAIAAATLATAGAAAEAVKSFQHDGVTYVYQTETASDGSTVLTGKAGASHTPFRLVVKNGQVTGSVDSRPVRFSVASSRGIAATAVALEPTKVAAAD